MGRNTEVGHIIDRGRTRCGRFGFEDVGVRRGYYQPSGMDAIVMRRELAR